MIHRNLDNRPAGRMADSGRRHETPKLTGLLLRPVSSRRVTVIDIRDAWIYAIRCLKGSSRPAAISIFGITTDAFGPV